MDIKNISKRLQNSTFILLIVGILVVINLLAALFFTRFDLTSVGLYSLSDATKTILQDLDDVVTVKVFFSHDLPAHVQPLAESMRDTLEEFDNYGGGNFEIQYLDPEKPEVQEEANDLGIPERQINVVEQDKVQVQNGYLGLAIQAGKKTEIIPVLTGSQNLEYELVSAIKKVTLEKVPQIGLLKGHGEHGINQGPVTDVNTQDDYEVFLRQLSSNYDISNVLIDQSKLIEDIDTLIVAGPQSELSERELYVIDQFIVRGGNVIFLVDNVTVNGATGQKRDTNLNDFIENFGVRVTDQVAGDARFHRQAAVNTGNFGFFIPYPYFVDVKEGGLNPEHPITARLGSVVLPWPGVLELDGENAEFLLSSSDAGFATGSPYNFDPNTGIPAVNDSSSQLGLAALSTGKFESMFDETNIPDIEDGEDESGNQKSTSKVDSIEFEPGGLHESAVLVIAESDFLTDLSLQSSEWPENLLFMLNAVDYMTLDESLLQIRSKSQGIQPLDEITDTRRQLMKFFGIATVPVIVLIYGIIRLTWRRKKASLN